MSGNITEKKTRQQLADELNVNVKTMRNSVRLANHLVSIEQNIGTEKAEKFNNIFAKLSRNKKEKISNSQIQLLSELPPKEQIRIVDLIIAHPNNAKRIINNAIPYCTTKTTVTLPVSVSDWLEDAAIDVGMSKAKYIETLLVGVYQKNGENEYEQ